MLNRALTFSTIAILFLLGLQVVWLYRIIDNEKNKYVFESEKILHESINDELDYRLRSITKRQNFNVSLSNTAPVVGKIKSSEEINITKSQELVTKISLEEALQEIYKHSVPLNLDTLASFFSKSLNAAGAGTRFTLHYISSDTIRNTVSTSESPTLGFFQPSFYLSLPLTVTKDLIIEAEIFYPRTVFKGDLLVILALSLIVTIFILFSIVMQTRMLYKQVSLAKVKENITHFLTHELRSPLQSSITNLEVGEIAEGDGYKYFLTKAKEQLYFLNGLIENILDINKFEKRQASLNKENFDINLAIEPHIARHNVDANKSVTITSSVESGNEYFYGDKMHLTNAIGNLIDNAIKYSGEIVEIKVSVHSLNKYFCISVQDNGIGIPKDEQTKVFEKFYRVSKREHSQKGKGFGLGLTYVMWVVKAHKGKIELSSEAGKGSTFTLMLKNEEYGTEDSFGR